MRQPISKPVLGPTSWVDADLGNEVVSTTNTYMIVFVCIEVPAPAQQSRVGQFAEDSVIESKKCENQDACQNEHAALPAGTGSNILAGVEVLAQD